MTLATVEAFSFRGPRSSSKAGVETYGYVWGSKKTHPNGDIVFFLDKLSISLTAKRAALSVEPNRRAGKIKDELFKPELNSCAQHHIDNKRQSTKDCTK
jgi:hypothetical protein